MRSKHADYMRDYWRARRSDPERWAREKDRLRGYREAKPVEDRKEYARNVMRKWRAHPENRAALIARDRQVSEDVLAHYGGVCACCAESRYEFLSIDHTNNDGAAHRRSIKKTPLRQWLKRNNFPPGFRVLCHNCNVSRGRYGYCPHERERQAAIPSDSA